MRDFNKVILTGRLTRDVEVRYTGKGTAVADATLASNHKFGETDEVNFIDLVFWGPKAEFAGEHLAKGKAILVEGRLQQQRWESDGQKRSKIVLVVEDVTFLPGNKGEDAPTPKAERKSSKTSKTDEDIPF
jgi:single-strand DNA-binding protein